METFKISNTRIVNMEKLEQTTGGLERKPLNRIQSKFDNLAVQQFVNENPDCMLKDSAAAFRGSISGAQHTLEEVNLCEA